MSDLDHGPQADHDPEPDERERLNAHLQQLSEEQFRRQMRQAAILLSSGNGADAIPLLERCFALHPEDVDVLVNLGGAYILAGQHRRAVPILERASELAPHEPAVWSNLAAAYLGNPVLATSEQQEKAIGALLRSVDLNPATPNAYYNLGLIYKDRGEWDRAAEAFAWAVKVDPRDRDALAWLKRAEAMRDATAGGETL